MTTLNATTAGMDMVSATMPGWGITIGVFITIIIILALVSKNLRHFIYGTIINGVLALLYWPSRYIGNSAGQGDYDPLKIFGIACALIITSIVIGKLSTKIPFIKRIEKTLEGS